MIISSFAYLQCVTKEKSFIEQFTDYPTMAKLKATTRTMWSSVLLLLLSSLPRPSALAAPAGETIGLEIGTAFGANWLDVEDEFSYSLLDSLSTIQRECPNYENEMTCSVKVATFCGFTARHANGVLDHVFFYETFHARHMFANCDDNVNQDEQRYEYGCRLLSCLEQCFADYPQQNECQEAVQDSKHKIQLLNEVEVLHDAYEIEFRRSLLAIALLSSVAGGLVIFLTKQLSSTAVAVGEEDYEAAKTADKCARCCIVFNWMAAFSMVGFILFRCPIFLVVIIPPFVFVHLAYYACCAGRRKNGERARIRANDETLYQLMLQEENPQQGKNGVEAAPVKVFVGVPIQIV